MELTYIAIKRSVFDRLSKNVIFILKYFYIKKAIA